MPATNKSRVMYILKHLQEQSDEEHPKTTTEIIDHLLSVGIEAGRKTIVSDIEQLQEARYDIFLQS